MPSMTCPSSSSAISVAHTGIPASSSASRRSGRRSSAAVPIQWRPAPRRGSRRAGARAEHGPQLVLDLRSASVTGVRSGFVSTTRSRERKRSSAIASAASARRAARASVRLTCARPVESVLRPGNGLCPGRLQSGLVRRLRSPSDTSSIEAPSPCPACFSRARIIGPPRRSTSRPEVDERDHAGADEQRYEDREEREPQAVVLARESSGDSTYTGVDRRCHEEQGGR
jgi:hypothetical protein